MNTVEREPVPTRVLNPKECGVQGRSRPGGGVQGNKAPSAKKMEKKIRQKSSETYAQFIF